MRWAIILVVVLVALAGCGAPVTPGSDTDTPGETSTETLNPTPTTTPEPTPTATPEPTPTATPTPDNPWQKEKVVVGVEVTTGPFQRNWTRPIGEAVSWWTPAHIERYAGHEMRFVLAPGAEDPDVEIRLMESIELCDETYQVDLAGCAPVVEGEASGTTTVEIRANLNDLRLRNTVIHELGHVLGLEHADEPRWIMAMSYDDTGEGSVPNATERAEPWNTTAPLRVHDNGVSGVSEAVETLANGHNLDVELTDESWAAEIHFLEGPHPDGVTDSGESAPVLYGLDWDTDSELEKYEEATVYLHDVRDKEGHAAYWIWRLAGKDVDDLPSKYK